MVDLNGFVSIGMIETGSHSIHEWEVMEGDDGEIRFKSHDDGEYDSYLDIEKMFKLKGDTTLEAQLDAVCAS